MFTRQHYKAIAEILNKTLQPEPAKSDFPEASNIRRGGINHAVITIGSDLANYFANDNERFDRDKFMAACGLTE